MKFFKQCDIPLPQVYPPHKDFPWVGCPFFWYTRLWSNIIVYIYSRGCTVSQKNMCSMEGRAQMKDYIILVIGEKEHILEEWGL